MKILTLFLFLILVSCAPANAKENSDSTNTSSSSNDNAGVTRRVAPAAPIFDDLFVVETDADSARESLDRVSGQIDRGFSSPDQSFKSEDQYKPGIFAREHAAENKNDNSSY